MPNPINKTNWTPEMDLFIRNNFEKLTNPQLADALGLRLTTTRTRLYELGLKRMELEYWNDEQIAFLKANYQQLGDTEIAEIFNEEYQKNKGWSKKHIVKKRHYLFLKRTKAEINAIWLRNKNNGRFAICGVKRWQTTGQTEVNQVHIWKPNGYAVKFLKTESGWKKLAHIIYAGTHGEIPKGYIISHVDGNSLNCQIENLKAISKDENMSRNCGSKNLTDAYVAGMMTHKSPDLRKYLRIANPELIELKRTQLLLNREINKHGKAK